MSIVILIDGSNFYHKLKDLKLSDKKFSFPDFCNWISEKTFDQCTYYVGAVRQEERNRKSRKLYAKQRSFLSSLQKEGINVELGFILKSNGVYHEKGVDVKIAVDLLVGAYENLYDKA